MTRELAKKHAPMIAAYGDGKDLQFLSVDGNWKDVTGEPLWADNEYRIKPQPKLREWKLEEMTALLPIVFRWKTNPCEPVVSTGITNGKLDYHGRLGSHEHASPSELLELGEYAVNGRWQPCGVEEAQ